MSRIALGRELNSRKVICKLFLSFRIIITQVNRLWDLNCHISSPAGIAFHWEMVCGMNEYLKQSFEVWGHLNWTLFPLRGALGFRSISVCLFMWHSRIYFNTYEAGCSTLNCFQAFLILIVNWHDSRLSITPMIRFRLRRSNSVFLQLQFEAFYTVNRLNAKWKVVPARNSGWKKRVPMNHNLPGGVWIWSCDSSLYGSRLAWGWPPFQPTESVNNFEKCILNIHIAFHNYKIKCTQNQTPVLLLSKMANLNYKIMMN